mgnify:CR=1 FL=1
MSRAERIERAILAARAVAATPETRDLHKRELKRTEKSNGKDMPLGSWTFEDERRLRDDGVIMTPRGPYRLRDA